MIIDWFTVGAQALNFLILVWLMKRFLYKPILHAIDERERRIAVALADANAKKTAAQKERDDFVELPSGTPDQRRMRQEPNVSGSSTRRGRSRTRSVPGGKRR